MGKKYIIELLDECNSKFKGIMAFGLTQEKQISVELIPEESLRPYTEPDLEQVRKEAYEKGRKDGKIEGRAEVWTVARNIDHMSDDDIKTCFKCGFSGFFEKYTASEAIEKIRQYEQEKEEQIQVGDEVSAAFGNAVVTEVETEHIYYFYKDGSYGSDKKKNVTKTGRHFPEIAAVLKKMRGEQDE